MKIFKTVKVSDEFEFINSENKKECAFVTYVDDKIFQTKVLRYMEWNNQFYEVTLSFYLSGKKTHYKYNHGHATKIVNKWSDL